MTHHLGSASVVNLPATFAGQVIHRGGAAYADARQLHNGLIDPHPAMIARCRSVVDAVDVLRVVRDAGVPLAIRGGGHNVGGLGSVDDGVVVDLSPMKGIYVDAGRRRARVEGGVCWRELNHVTQLHGLATTGGAVSTTGVAGLTLGGGLGWLLGKFGLALDNLVSAQVVTADGEVLNASEAEHADLFWALRGAGANFGVVTSFEFQLHDVGPIIMGGLIAYPLSAARDVLRFFRDLTAEIPDEVSLAAALTYAPDGSGIPIVAILLCHAGRVEDAEPLARRIKTFGHPAVDRIGPLPYEMQNRMLDDGFPRGTRNYWKSRFVDTLSDGLLDNLARTFAECPSPLSTLIIEHLHGAAARRPTDATAFFHRRAGYSLLTMAQWQQAVDDQRSITWARDTYRAMAATEDSAAYVNYLDRDEPADRVAAAYGSNLLRLRALKRKYDPTNLFRVNHNIAPG